MGRPKLSDGRRRSIPVTVWLTVAEDDALRLDGEQRGLSRSDLVRLAILRELKEGEL